MDSETIDAVTGWNSAPATAGYEGLRSLADDGFTGAVVADMTWGFMLNGRLLGVFDGAVEDFDGASFEAYSAPEPVLPLLFAMRELGGETRAQYYTEETPITDADGTLSAGGFTGYIELSENVLSGDYYVVYHAGNSMSAAFVGSSKRLVTGDDAFDRASDEVGIYNVVDVDLELVDIPEGDADPEADDDPAANDVAAAAADTDPETDAEADGPATDAESDAAAPEAPPAEADAADEAERSDSEATTAAAGDDDVEPAASGQSAGADARSDATGEASSPTKPSAADAETTAHDAKSSAREAETATRADDSAPEANASADESASTSGDDAGSDVFSAEAQWRNARSIPSLDPRDATGETVDDRPTKKRRSARSASQRQQTRSRPAGNRQQSPSGTPTAQDRTPATPADPSQVTSLKERISSLESERDRLESERDSLRSERDDAQSKAARLEARVEELEAEVDRLEEALDEAGFQSSTHTMSPDDALAGTNLFVRYGRKGEATLEEAHAGQAKLADVEENLRLEHHTTFDTDGLHVDGRPYEEFLHDSAEFGFAHWVVTDLLYEIGETGNRSSLAGVFDAIPKVDRVELFGSVSVSLGEGESESRRFDVIFRDQMGDPLFVANMNDSRDPATQPMVTQLIKDSKVVAEGKDTLDAAFVVTASFFEPDALEAATAETGGGLLSRSKRKSFVKLSRKQGYHLCLVEARNGEFHLNVPDL